MASRGLYATGVSTDLNGETSLHYEEPYTQYLLYSHLP